MQQDNAMLRVTRWCIGHRRRVAAAWVAIAILTTVVAGSVGNRYATNFTLPGTESQRASDLLTKEFGARSGDADTIVFHVGHGTIDSQRVSGAITPVLARVRTFPHVAKVVSPYAANGEVQVSRDRMTAFATIDYDKDANLLPNGVGTRLLDEVNAVHVPGVQLAAGSQLIENAEGYSVGPATEIGVIAALVILLSTFGSVIAAGMPLITAGLGLITGVALIGLSTHVMSMSTSPRSWR